MQEDNKEKQERDPIAETIKIGLEGLDEVEQRRVCQACYFKGQSDAFRTFIFMMFVTFIAAYALRKVVTLVAE